MAAPDQAQANPLCPWRGLHGWRWSDEEIAVKPACSANPT
jgi:hypothetical protein